MDITTKIIIFFIFVLSIVLIISFIQGLTQKLFVSYAVFKNGTFAGVGGCVVQVPKFGNEEKIIAFILSSIKSDINNDAYKPAIISIGRL